MTPSIYPDEQARLRSLLAAEDLGFDDLTVDRGVLIVADRRAAKLIRRSAFWEATDLSEIQTPDDFELWEDALDELDERAAERGESTSRTPQAASGG